MNVLAAECFFLSTANFIPRYLRDQTEISKQTSFYFYEYIILSLTEYNKAPRKSKLDS